MYFRRVLAFGGLELADDLVRHEELAVFLLNDVHPLSEASWANRILHSLSTLDILPHVLAVSTASPHIFLLSNDSEV